MRLDEDFWLNVSVGVFVVLGIGFCAYIIAQATAQEKCLSMGWPSAKLDYTLKQYCVKRVDQTDVVRPLNELRAEAVMRGNASR